MQEEQRMARERVANEGGMVPPADAPMIPPQHFLSEIASLIQNLRQLSIQVVEQIVLWRDQLRQIYLLSTTISQKIARKRKVQAAI